MSRSSRPRCQKVRYGSEAEAEAANNVVGPSLGDFTMTPYRCGCGWWHLGHQDPNDKQRAIDRQRRARPEGKTIRPDEWARRRNR